MMVLAAKLLLIVVPPLVIAAAWQKRTGAAWTGSVLDYPEGVDPGRQFSLDTGHVAGMSIRSNRNDFQCGHITGGPVWRATTAFAAPVGCGFALRPD